MDGVCLRWTKMDEDRQRWPKFLTARCVMLANITAFGRPKAFLLAFGSTIALTRAGKEEGEAMPTKMRESRDRNRPLSKRCSDLTFQFGLTDARV